MLGQQKQMNQGSISLEFCQRRWLRRYQVNSLWNVHPKSPDHQITKPFSSSISSWLWLLLGCWIEMFEFPIFKILSTSITRIYLILVLWIGVFSLDKTACLIIRFVFGFCISLSSQICSLFIFRDFQENEWQKLWKPSEVKFKRDTLRIVCLYNLNLLTIYCTCEACSSFSIIVNHNVKDRRHYSNCFKSHCGFLPKLAHYE